MVLFENLYAGNGSLSVKELSERACWSSRQIGRYFKQQFGLSLKAYCNILRFWSSLEGLAQGKFFPDLSFADQCAATYRKARKENRYLPEYYNH